jgi:hypothetical protein
VVTAGIQTWEVGYEPLARRIETVGFVEFDERKLYRVAANVKGRIDKLFANVTGEMVRPGDPLASVYSPDIASTLRTCSTPGHRTRTCTVIDCADGPSATTASRRSRRRWSGSANPSPR